MLAARSAKRAEVGFGVALVFSDQGVGKGDVGDLAGGNQVGKRQRGLPAFG